MDRGKRNTLNGWISQASNQLSAAREHLSRCEYSESVQAAQQCVELSVKAITAFLGIDCPRTHSWSAKELASVVEEIEKRSLIERISQRGYPVHLPRLLLLFKFWGEFYLIAKYGIQEHLLAPARDLFRQEEAEFAIRHAQETWFAAHHFQLIDDTALDTLCAP
jgi:hypothetical protein